jgi:hypothetical protein
VILDLGGEDVTVLALPGDGDWSEVEERVVRTIAPLEPHLSETNGTLAGWQLYLPAGDPISRTARVRVRGVVHSVEGQPDVWPGTCVVVRVVTAARSALVSLRKPETSAWSDDEKATVVTPANVYASAVPAGIQAQINRSNNDAVSAEETLSEQPYVVTIDQDLPPAEDDEVLVTACPEDLSMVGRVLRIEHVVRGTERFERQLLCTLIDN